VRPRRCGAARRRRICMRVAEPGDARARTGQSGAQCACVNAGRPSAPIELIARPARPSGVVLHVRDHGPGVPEALAGAAGRTVLPRRHLGAAATAAVSACLALVKRCWSKPAKVKVAFRQSRRRRFEAKIRLRRRCGQSLKRRHVRAMIFFYRRDRRDRRGNNEAGGSSLRPVT